MTVYARAGLVILLAWLLFTLFVVVVFQAASLGIRLLCSRPARRSSGSDVASDRERHARLSAQSPDSRGRADTATLAQAGRAVPPVRSASVLFECDPRRMN